MRKITIYFLFTALMLMCVACDKNFIKNGTYVSVDNEEYYITIKDETVTLDNPVFNEDLNEWYHTLVYLQRQGEMDPGIILTDEEMENLKKDIPDIIPSDYIGKVYKLDWMNEETYVQGEAYDIMSWEEDEPIELFSGEYYPETDILNLGGTEYILKK